jgi:hypothetical protein
MSLSAVEIESGQPKKAEPHARQAVEIFERLANQSVDDPARASALLGAQTNLALILQGTARHGEAAEVYARAQKIAEGLVREQPANPSHKIALAALCLNRGNLERDSGRPRGSLEWFDRGIAAADAALAIDGRLSEALLWKLNTHGSRAQTYEALKDYAAAVRDWDYVVAHSQEADRLIYRLLRAVALARAGEAARIESETAELAGLVQDVPALLHLAEVCAVVRPRTDALSQRAASLIRRALAVADARQKLDIVRVIVASPDLRTVPLAPDSASAGRLGP